MTFPRSKVRHSFSVAVIFVMVVIIFSLSAAIIGLSIHLI